MVLFCNSIPDQVTWKEIERAFGLPLRKVDAAFQMNPEKASGGLWTTTDLREVMAVDSAHTAACPSSTIAVFRRYWRPSKLENSRCDDFPLEFFHAKNETPPHAAATKMTPSHGKN